MANRKNLKQNQVFSSIDEVRAAYLPSGAALYHGALENPQQIASVMAEHIVNDVVQRVGAKNSTNRRRQSRLSGR